MRFRWVVVVGVVAAVPVAWLLLQPRSPKEFIISGRPISEVLRDLASPDVTTRQRATDSLRTAGTNALAPLLEWISLRDPKDARELVAPDDSGGLFQPRRLAPAPVRRSQAVRGFGVLGRAASPAAPELESLLDGQESAAPAAMALAATGPVGVSVLIPRLASDDARLRELVATALQTLGPGDSDCVPLLLAAVGEGTAPKRPVLILCLGRIGRDLDALMPIFLEGLRSDSVEERAASLRALAMVGSAAKDAAPQLLALARSTGSDASKLAAHALCKVAPDLAAKSGIRDPFTTEVPAVAEK